jgi:hypothetical protein
LQLVQELGANVEFVNDARGAIGFRDEALACRQDLGDTEGEIDE